MNNHTPTRTSTTKTKLKAFARRLIDSVPKRVALVLFLVALVVVPALSNAAAPTYTWDYPAPSVQFNSITDNPHWPGGDERQSTKIVDQSGNYVNEVDNVKDGQIYTVKMLVHNDASLNLKLNAVGVAAAFGASSHPNANNQYIQGVVVANNFGATITGNTGAPGSVRSQVNFTSNNNFQLSFVPGSGQYETQFGADGLQSTPNKVFQLSDSVLDHGVWIGANALDGQVLGCWPHHGILVAKFKVNAPAAPVKTPKYDVQKSVSATTANPGDTITYTLTAKNTGDEDLTNVKLNDKLPQYYTNASETINAPAGSTAQGSIVKQGSVTFAKLSVGQQASVTIKYTLKAANDLNCGQTVIPNVVTSSTDQTSTEDDKNNNAVSTTVNRDCTPAKTSHYDVQKSVDRTTANPGDTIKYTITVKNTGTANLTNIKLTDKLPQHVTITSGPATSPSTKTAGNIFDNTGKNPLVIASLNAGQTLTLTYTAKLDQSANLPCGVTNLQNTVSSSTDQTNTEDNKNNNSATTTVNNVCAETHPATPQTPATIAPGTFTPTQIVATGPAQAIVAVIAAGALTFATFAYLDSRKAVKKDK